MPPRGPPLTCDVTLTTPPAGNRDPRMCQEPRPRPGGACIGSACNREGCLPIFAAPPRPPSGAEGEKVFRDKAQAPQIKVVKLPLSDSRPWLERARFLLMCCPDHRTGRVGAEGREGASKKSAQLEQELPTRADDQSWLGEAGGVSQGKGIGAVIIGLGSLALAIQF